MEHCGRPIKSPLLTNLIALADINIWASISIEVSWELSSEVNLEGYQPRRADDVRNHDRLDGCLESPFLARSDPGALMRTFDPSEKLRAFWCSRFDVP